MRVILWSNHELADTKFGAVANSYKVFEDDAEDEVGKSICHVRPFKVEEVPTRTCANRRVFEIQMPQRVTHKMSMPTLPVVSDRLGAGGVGDVPQSLVEWLRQVCQRCVTSRTSESSQTIGTCL